MPVLFMGHGSPMNAIEDNTFTNTWKTIAKSIPKPKLILCISAHWLTNKTAILSKINPETIHDFYGFPKELNELEYPAKGSVDFAKLVKETIKSVDVNLNETWGLDHGTWSVLVKMYPKADIPVIQLSINPNLPLATHIQIGKELAVLRSQGVLILGSGNIVHNLGMIRFEGEPFSWAVEFDEHVRKSLENRNIENILNYTKNKNGKLAVPTTDHYIPLLYIVGASDLTEEPKFYCTEVVYSSLSMTCVVYGLK